MEGSVSTPSHLADFLLSIRIGDGVEDHNRKSEA